MDYLPDFVVEGGGGVVTFVPRQPLAGVVVGAREKHIEADIDELLNSFKPQQTSEAVTGGDESSEEPNLTEEIEDVELSEPIEPVDSE